MIDQGHIVIRAIIQRVLPSRHFFWSEDGTEKANSIEMSAQIVKVEMFSFFNLFSYLRIR